jgi:hypothetical protein
MAPYEPALEQLDEYAETSSVHKPARVAVNQERPRPGNGTMPCAKPIGVKEIVRQGQSTHIQHSEDMTIYIAFLTSPAIWIWPNPICHSSSSCSISLA